MTSKTFGTSTARAMMVCAVCAMTVSGAAQSAFSAPAPAPAHAPAASTRSAELPELGGPGSLAIGTARHDLLLGKRTISVRLWYPAKTAKSAKPAIYRHTVITATAPPYEITEHGSAIAGATALSGKGRFPLVVMSHGFGGWDTHMSQLAEGLASHGYVVAAIDHHDLPVPDLLGFAVSFGSVLVNRAEDQRAVLRQLLAGQLGGPEVTALIDAQNIGLLGYSMGGYGVLTSAGAVVDPGAPALAQLPAAARQLAARRDDEIASKIKAVIALAPWGAQPSAGVWNDAGLTGITAPLLLIDGDQDDVVDYAQGTQRVFDKTTRTDRYLLTFREAGHNIAGNPVARRGDEAFSTIEYFNDAVWRQERIVGIDQHFALAFFDLTLKHDTAKARYLAVPTRDSNAGQWPSSFRQQWGGTVAGAAQPQYWRGFQRRWARGLSLDHKARDR